MLFQHLAVSLTFAQKASTFIEQLKLSKKPNTEEAGLLKSQFHVGKGEKLNIAWPFLSIAWRREKSLS